MVGEDAVSITVQVLMKLLDMLIKQGELKRQEQMRNADRKPVLKSGSISQDDIAKLTSQGVQFNYFPVDKRLSAALEDKFKSLGGTYLSVSDPDGKSNVFAIPVSQQSLYDFATKQILSDKMRNDPFSLTLKDGASRIAAEDMALVSTVLQGYDVPATIFKEKDGNYIACIDPKDNDGFNKAMNKAHEIKESMKDIEIIPFNLTESLNNQTYTARTITHEEAVELYKTVKAKGIDVQFVPNKSGNKTDICYPRFQNRDVENILSDIKKGASQRDDYLVSIKDTTVITLDISSENKLLEKEFDDSYLFRVPKRKNVENDNDKETFYIKLNKDDMQLVNDGKSLKTRLDREMTYDTFDKDGTKTGTISASELMMHFDRKRKDIPKDAAIYEYGSGIDRIELYNSKENKLISIGVEDAEKVKLHLAEQGITGRTADNLLKDIDKELEKSPTLREKFSFTEEKPEVVYSVVPNMDNMLAVTMISETVMTRAECIGENVVAGEPQLHNGMACCVFDKEKNQYILCNTEKLRDNLSSFGYNDVVSKVVEDRVSTVKNNIDVTEAHNFPTTEKGTMELNDYKYGISDNNMVIVHNDKEEVKYLTIDKNYTVDEIDKKLGENFNLNEVSRAVIVKEAIENGYIQPPTLTVLDDIKITKLTEKMVEVQLADNSFFGSQVSTMMPYDNLDRMALTAVGMSEKNIATLERSLNKAFSNKDKPDTLTGLKAFAEKTYTNTLGKAVEKVKETTKTEAIR